MKLKISSYLLYYDIYDIKFIYIVFYLTLSFLIKNKDYYVNKKLIA